MIDLATAREAFATGTGEGITVAILDTGIDKNHPFFAQAKILPQIEIGEAFDISEKEAHDPVGHGTAIAGIIHQLAPEAALLPVRVLTSGPRQSRHQVISEGAHEALRKGTQILNCSFGVPATPHTCFLYKEWIDQAHDQEHFIISAASNSSINFPEWPSAFRTTLAVADGSTPPQTILYQSHQNISFFANGSNINVPTPGGGFTTVTGNSFAAAHLSAMTARFLSQLPNSSPWFIQELIKQLSPIHSE